MNQVKNFRDFNSLIGPINQINLKRLERESYKYLYIGLVVALLFHAWILFLYPAGETKIADVKNIQVELVKVQPKITRPVLIPPRITKPLSTHKITTRDIYRFRRKSGIGVPSAPRGLKNPFALDNSDIKTQRVTPEIISGKTIGTLHDSILAQEIILSMPKDTIPFSSEIFVDKGNIQSSKSMIIIPPGNKMAIQGYTHIASIYGEEFAPQDTLIHAFEALADAVNFYTNIDAKCDSRIKLSDTIYKYPLIYLCYDKPFELTEEEKDVFVNYINSGGFIIINNPLPEVDGGRVGNSLKHAFIDAFYERSSYSRTVEHISKKHELYHCFFDFNDGPPVEYRKDSRIKNTIDGLYLSRRLIGLYLAGYGLFWNDKRNEQQLKMGVNMVVYALKRGKGQYNYFSGELVSFDKKNPVKVW